MYSEGAMNSMVDDCERKQAKNLRQPNSPNLARVWTKAHLALGPPAGVAVGLGHRVVQEFLRDCNSDFKKCNFCMY